jgi:hypothetical protein
VCCGMLRHMKFSKIIFVSLMRLFLICTIYSIYFGTNTYIIFHYLSRLNIWLELERMVLTNFFHVLAS